MLNRQPTIQSKSMPTPSSPASLASRSPPYELRGVRFLSYSHPPTSIAFDFGVGMMGSLGETSNAGKLVLVYARMCRESIEPDACTSTAMVGVWRSLFLCLVNFAAG
ncbi:hypothetical protein ACJRO7_014988 [Eucalyptus globulus]|uniref:Uncharacterized protein n=1 Tax=Eucalyptus globulus TaxID=34317 RepID=A0ABD3L2S1_EUCGL